MVRNLRWQTRWILGQNCKEDAAASRRNQSSDVPVCQHLGERTIKKQRRREDINTLQWQYVKILSELLLQMVISVNQLSIYGAVADMIKESPIGQKAAVKPAAPGQLDKQEILTQPPLAQEQANEERQGNLLQEYEQRFEKLSEDQMLSKI